MTQRLLRGAFIGFGNVAAKGHLPGWQARNDVAIVAAADAAAVQREIFSAACPDGRWYDNAAELLARETLEFVDICAPPGSHAALVKQALNAGLHVLCEKPLVTRVEDALAVRAAAARAGRVVHTVHNWLEAPVCIKISALIAEGAIGAVRSIRWRTLRTQPAISVAADGGANWRVDPAMAGGGILFDHGWHALYCILRWAGGAPRGVAAVLETRRFHEWPLEDTATVSLDLTAGSADIYLTWTADERSNHIEIEGEQGSIRALGATVLVKSKRGERRWLCPPDLSEGSHHPDWFTGVADDFHAAATGGNKGNLDEALMCARLVDLAERSSAAGGTRLPVDA
jgi:predicted dehydrogenase